MKIILSRKGFDSQYGGHPSPILPDGRLLSIPIPLDDNCRYSQLSVDGKRTYADIMKMLYPTILKNGIRVRITDQTTCHLDPDICYPIKRRAGGWKGAFGQVDAAQGHLTNQGIGEGDLFLFFGWFRKTRWVNDRLCFDPSDKSGAHIIFGYLQVGEIKYSSDELLVMPTWLKGHPHTIASYRSKSNNAIYLAKRCLTWDRRKKGYGVFCYAPELVLTKPGALRTQWALPSIFKQSKISYHKQSNWKEGYFQSAAKGQEFVVCGTQMVEAWAKRLISKECI
jgi:hypothetical protein